MNTLSTPSIASRLNALAAAALVTLMLAGGIDRLATSQNSAPQMVKSAPTQAA